MLIWLLITGFSTNQLSVTQLLIQLLINDYWFVCKQYTCMSQIIYFYKLLITTFLYAKLPFYCLQCSLTLLNTSLSSSTTFTTIPILVLSAQVPCTYFYVMKEVFISFCWSKKAWISKINRNPKLFLYRLQGLWESFMKAMHSHGLCVFYFDPCNLQFHIELKSVAMQEGSRKKVITT